ncbi:hypothetical protein B7C51_07635 [Paenibacillus larvae subsp. pulvifaciens]|uniref:Uncharacterized protein n=1 Tax=Paenibacillus larvae subsp. pulvifaciens TaxID=1477 RepID=A0A1V0UR22_9BACL|nr:hypothetical protein [Paenibacillus larvae]ARF67729.1 hypothetical protein B7C51_07635 [Paenibacillus larvae subsp. pulvifaciens]
MEELLASRTRYRTLKIELLKLSKRFEGADPEDILFYQEICEKYASHLKAIETACYERIGASICNCQFHSEQQCN